MPIWAIVAIVVAILFAILGVLCGVWACIQVEAFKRSTHQVTFVDPTKQHFEQISEETKARLAPHNDSN